MEVYRPARLRRGRLRKGVTVATEATPTLNLDVLNAQGQTVGTVELDPTELAAGINKQLLHEVVLMYRANKRAGTHSTLRRGEVAGSTKKIFRQKGTGNARAGTKRTNKRRGGGTAKGPKPRDYYYRLPKRSVQAATRMALLSRLQDRETVVVDELKFPEIKTRQVAQVLQALNLGETTCLIGLGATDVDEQKTIYKSARNIKNVSVSPAALFNAYDLLKPKRLLLTRAALTELCKSAKWNAK